MQNGCSAFSSVVKATGLPPNHPVDDMESDSGSSERLHNAPFKITVLLSTVAC